MSEKEREREGERERKRVRREREREREGEREGREKRREREREGERKALKAFKALKETVQVMVSVGIVRSAAVSWPCSACRPYRCGRHSRGLF